MDRKCPVHGCKNQKNDEWLVCRNHWWRVPKPIQKKLWDAYRDPSPGAKERHREIAFQILADLNKLAVSRESKLQGDEHAHKRGTDGIEQRPPRSTR